MKIKSRKIIAILLVTMFVLSFMPMSAFAASDYSSAASRITDVDPDDPAVGKDAEFEVLFRSSGNVPKTGTVAFYISSSRDAEKMKLIDDDNGNDYTDPLSDAEYDLSVTQKVYANAVAGYVKFNVTSDIAGEVTVKVGRTVNDDNQVTNLLTNGTQVITFGEAEVDNVVLSAPATAQAGVSFDLIATVEDENNNIIEGEEVTFQEKRAGRWVSIGTADTKYDGTAKLEVRRNDAKEFEFRASAAGENSVAEFVNVLGADPFAISADTERTSVETDEIAKVKFNLEDRYGNVIDASTVAAGTHINAEITKPDNKKMDSGDIGYGNDKKKFQVEFTPDKDGKYVVETFIDGTSISAVTEVFAGEFGDVTEIAVKVDEDALRARDGDAISIVIATTDDTLPEYAMRTEVSADLFDEEGIKKSAAAGDVEFYSSNPSVARIVDNEWIVAGDRVSGTVTITGVHVDTGIVASIEVTVAGAPTAIDVDVEVRGLEADVTMTLLDRDGNKAREEANKEDYRVIMPADVGYFDKEEFEEGVATFSLSAEEVGTYFIQVVSDEGIAAAFDVTFTDEVIEDPAAPVAPKYGAANVTMFIGAPGYSVDGAGSTTDVPPYIDPATGRTMVGVRMIAEALGAEADWGPKDEATEWVTLTREDRVITINIGELVLEVAMDDEVESITTDQAAEIKDGRTVLPFRAIAEAFGADVDYGTDAAGNVEWVSFSQ